MLNLPIVMLKTLLLLTFLFQSATVTLTSPQAGDTLRGQTEINGTMDVPGFASAELAFAYSGASDSAGSWFTIQTFPQPKTDSPLTVWDTTSVTDGDYVLRLRVFLQDGTTQDATIADLKIRNDVPVPTQTPEEVFEFPTPASQMTESALPQVTPTQGIPQPTPLPPNPASVNKDSIYSTFARGALLALVLFALFSFFIRLRKNN
jgi:hypothetical protein